MPGKGLGVDIPESVKRATVTGDILRVVLDSADPGPLMEGEPLRGLRAVVEATVPYLRVDGRTYVLEPMVFVTNQAGEIVNSRDPDAGLLIPATTGNGVEFLYQVSITWDHQSEKHKRAFVWRAPAPEGGVLDLGLVIDAPAPEDVPGWMQSQLEIAAARGEILQALDDVTALHGEVVELTAGNVFDDSVTSELLGWSSQKIDDAKADKSHTHTAAQTTSGVFAAARLPQASTAARGAVELATPAETTTGTDATRAVTPAGVAAVTADTMGETPTAWYGTTSQVLTTPTHDGSGEATHASVLYFDTPWNGYSYWMLMTPYPANREADEDPNILASTDGTTWVVPAGLTNPLDNQAGSPNPHNSDTNLAMRDGVMYATWRMVDRPNGNTNGSAVGLVESKSA